MEKLGERTYDCMPHGSGLGRLGDIDDDISKNLCDREAQPKRGQLKMIGFDDITNVEEAWYIN